jgi:hypothetical protein
VPLQSLRVHFNRVTRDVIDSDSIIRGVADMKPHPQYSPSSNQFVRFFLNLIHSLQEWSLQMQNNVALVKLDAPVLSIPLIRLASVANLFTNQPATIYGFGVNRIPLTVSSTDSNTLLQGSLTVLSPEGCTARFGPKFGPQHLCAVGPQPPCLVS